MTDRTSNGNTGTSLIPINPYIEDGGYGLVLGGIIYGFIHPEKINTAADGNYYLNIFESAENDPGFSDAPTGGSGRREFGISFDYPRTEESTGLSGYDDLDRYISLLNAHAQNSYTRHSAALTRGESGSFSIYAMLNTGYAGDDSFLNSLRYAPELTTTLANSWNFRQSGNLPASTSARDVENLGDHQGDSLRFINPFRTIDAPSGYVGGVLPETNNVITPVNLTVGNLASDNYPSAVFTLAANGEGGYDAGVRWRGQGDGYYDNKKFFIADNTLYFKKGYATGDFESKKPPVYNLRLKVTDASLADARYIDYEVRLKNLFDTGTVLSTTSDAPPLIWNIGAGPEASGRITQAVSGGSLHLLGDNGVTDLDPRVNVFQNGNGRFTFNPQTGEWTYDVLARSNWSFFTDVFDIVHVPDARTSQTVSNLSIRLPVATEHVLSRGIAESAGGSLSGTEGHYTDYTFGIVSGGNVVSSLTGDYGTLAIVNHKKGVWNYTLGSDADFPAFARLAPGEIVSDRFKVKVTDPYGSYQTRINITIQGEIDSVDIYENHPVHKLVHDFDVDGEGTLITRRGWFINSLDGEHDGRFFNIDRQTGELYARRVLDHEAPVDDNFDGIYRIRADFLDVAGRVLAEKYLDIHVNDLPGIETSTESQGEFARDRVLTIRPDLFNAANLPGADVQHILGDYLWKVPDTGPLYLTWALLTPDPDDTQWQYPYDLYDHERTYGSHNPRTDSPYGDQASIDSGREWIEERLSSIENVANIRFIEVANDANSKADLIFSIWDRPARDDGGSSSSGFSTGITYYNVTDVDSAGINPTVQEKTAFLHELMHSLGFSHPFTAKNGWPGSAHSSTVVGYDSIANLTQTDIDALQWAYGAPNTNFSGAESKIRASGFTPPDTPDFFEPDQTSSFQNYMSPPEDII